MTFDGASLLGWSLTHTGQVLLRAYVRVVMIKNVAADDWWMLASIVRLHAPIRTRQGLTVPIACIHGLLDRGIVGNY